MGKTIVNVMMTGLESIMQFVTGGRIFVCAVLAVLFLPITLGVCTLAAVLLPIWYALHIHLAIGAAVVALMVVLAYQSINGNTLGPKYNYKYRVYEYWEKDDWDSDKFKLTAKDTYKSDDYSILRAPYALLLSVHIAIANAWMERRLPLKSSERKTWAHDTEGATRILTNIAWSYPAYIALGIGVLMTLVYFVNTLIFGSADTFVSDIIHGPWLYLAGNFGG